MHVLYYSDKCDHCKRLMSENDLSAYKLVDVNTLMHTNRLPSYVTMVPTLVDMQANRKYEGTAVFTFIKDNARIEPYAFSCSNNTNTGFSFIDSDRPVYSEQVNYSPFE